MKCSRSEWQLKSFGVIPFDLCDFLNSGNCRVKLTLYTKVMRMFVGSVEKFTCMWNDKCESERFLTPLWFYIDGRGLIKKKELLCKNGCNSNRCACITCFVLRAKVRCCRKLCFCFFFYQQCTWGTIWLIIFGRSLILTSLVFA